MMMSKVITLLEQAVNSNDDIREWIRQSAGLKTWKKYKLFLHQEHREYKRDVTTAGKGGYTATVKKIYGAPPPSPEDHHEVIEDIKKIVQVIRTRGYELEELAQDNAVLTTSNSSVMAQLEHMTVTMNAMQEELKTIASAQTNQARPEINFYCWICASNFTHGSKT